MDKPTCKAEGCTGKVNARGLCARHYNEQRRNTAPICSVDDCTERVLVRSRGLCEMHNGRWRRTGATDLVRKRSICTVDDCDGFVDSHGLCPKHLYRVKRNGTTDPRPKSDRRCEVEGCDRPFLARGMCKRHYRNDEYARKREEIREQRRAWHRANPDKTREWHRRQYARRGDEIRAQARRWRAENPDVARESKRRYNVKHAAELAARKRAYYQRNAARLAVYYREWALKHPDRRRANHALRRARIRTTKAEPVDYEVIRAEFGDTCNICREPINPGDEIHFDHVIPLARGGTHTYDNVRPAHADCNLRKGARLVS